MKKSFIAALIIGLFIFAGFKSKAASNKMFCEEGTIGAFENANTSPTVDSFSVIFGRWKIMRVVEGDAGVMPDDKKVKSLMDKTILFTWRMAVVFSDTCFTPLYDSRFYNKEEFLFKSLGQQSDIGIKSDTLKVARLRCGGRTVYKANVANNYYYRFIMLDEQTLIMPYAGNFFFLSRVNEKSTVVASKKAVPVATIEKPAKEDTEGASTSGNIFLNLNDPSDPFHVLSSLVNSAVKLAK